jgi:AraC-like DNA-binding protein
MTQKPRLDRLSALLEGLAPRISVIQPTASNTKIDIAASTKAALHLHLLAGSEMVLTTPQTGRVTLTSPAIVVCRADIAHTLEATSADTFSRLMCAQAVMEGPIATLLLNEFTEPQVISLDQADASLNHVIQLISSELLAPRCGQPALLDRAGDILFIGLLRHLIAHPKHQGGLFDGLADPRIARALVAMHATPQTDWTLETLAEEAGMSRTAFANTFRQIMNQPPGKYLSQIRLAIAQRAVESGKGLKTAARDAGYASPSALSRALSRMSSLK